MEQPILDFAGRLRKAGIKVSPVEVIDALGILSLMTLHDRSLFRDALRSTLIKRARDIPVFDTLFDLYFSGGPMVGAMPDQPEEREWEQVPARMAEARDVRQADLSPVTEMIMTSRFGPLTRLLMARSQDLGLQRREILPIRGNFFVSRLRGLMGLDRVRAETEDLAADIEDRLRDPESARAVREYMDRNLDRLERELEDLIEREVAKNRFLGLRRLEDEDLANRNLFRLTERDFLAMRPAVDRLARRLKDRLSLRLKRAQRGRFDIKTTLRKNVGYGGPLPDLHFRNKKPGRPQVVALCDVSQSVRDFSRFMLLFLYTLKEVIARIRSFIFVGDLAEVTGIFQQYDLNEAVSIAAAGYGLIYRFGTDYGSSLTQFVEEHLTVINSRTTVIILGDARNNQLPTRLEALEAMAARAKKLIWLNPEPRPFWGTGDSVMDVYAPLCTTVAECGTLNQLSTVIEENIIP
ncbi:MAG: VWA domain-containing protein [Deltaproteobacteria bacterium]